MSVSTNDGGSMEWGGSGNMYRHFQVMADLLKTPKILICPADKRQAATDFTNFNNSNLSYFVGLDADEARPAMILSGDRNLMTNGSPVRSGLVTITTNDKLSWNSNMHERAGDMGLADASVQQVDDAALQKYFQQSGTNINRLAVP